MHFSDNVCESLNLNCWRKKKTGKLCTSFALEGTNLSRPGNIYNDALRKLNVNNTWIMFKYIIIVEWCDLPALVTGNLLRLHSSWPPLNATEEAWECSKRNMIPNNHRRQYLIGSMKVLNLSQKYEHTKNDILRAYFMLTLDYYETKDEGSEEAHS